MAKILDDLSKNLAGGMTRRRALKAFGAGLVGAVAFWKETGTSLALVSTGTACENFCDDLYGNLYFGTLGTTVRTACLNRCLPLTPVEADRVSCPEYTTPVLIGQHYPPRNESDAGYNPFPQILARPYIVCAPDRRFFLNSCDLAVRRRINR